MANIFDNLREVVDYFNNNKDYLQQIADERSDAMAAQYALEDRSHNNVRFGLDNYYDEVVGPIRMGKDFTDTLSDAVDFYKKEFGITPRVTIGNNQQYFDENPGVQGLTKTAVDPEGQHDVWLRYFRQNYDPEHAKIDSAHAEENGWWPKNSGDKLGTTMVHELGHALHNMFYDDNYYDPSESQRHTRELYKAALNDMGINFDDDYTYRYIDDPEGVIWYNPGQNRDKVMEEVSKISGYAADDEGGWWLDGYEVVAEALTDYYYNRDNAAPLSKAIINRMKSDGKLYPTIQAGGVNPNETFVQHLRRFSPIQ